MEKKKLFLILPLFVFTFFSGCNRISEEEGYHSHDFRHPHEKSPRDFHKFHHSRVDKMAEDLNLTPDQVEALKEMEKEIREKQFEMRKERKRRDIVKERIVEMIRKDSLSQEEIIRFMEEVHAMGEQLRKETDSFIAERLAKMHAILTERQRERLAKKLEEFEPRRDFREKKDKE